MKPRGKILNETTLELNLSAAQVIDKLRAQQGDFYCKSLPDTKFLFTCDEKGNIKMGINHNSRRKIRMQQYYVCGEIFEQDGKTKIIIYCLQNKTYLVLNCVFMLLFLLWVIIDLVHHLYDRANGEYVRFQWIGNPIKLLILAPPLFFKTLEKSDRKSVVYAMKNNLIERVNNIECKNQQEHSK